MNMDPGKTYVDCCQPPCLSSLRSKGESGPGDLFPPGSEGDDAKYPAPEVAILEVRRVFPVPRRRQEGRLRGQREKAKGWPAGPAPTDQAVVLLASWPL